MEPGKPRPEDSKADSRATAAQFPEHLDQAPVADVKPWELIDADAGRYMPRRIRGSFRGRALG